MRRGIVGIVLLAACGPCVAMSWSDLWARRDQQTITARRQAYTEIQGQQYAAAAQHLEPYVDPVSRYNRGNALARGGDLKGALAAYDAVLKDGATDANLKRDAQHNRDLVAKQLQSQSDKSDKSGKSDQQDRSGEQGGKDQRGAQDKQDKQDKQDNKDGKDSKDGKDDKSDKSDKGDKGGQGGQDAKDAQQPHDASSAAQSEQQSQQTQQQQGGDQDKKNPAPSAAARPGDNRAAEPPSAAETEQAQSLDQWLRWIPDDPSGLLRRKFMIEHMQHQREEQK